MISLAHIRVIKTRSIYKGHIAILQHSAKEILSSVFGHPVELASLLHSPVSYITWGDEGQKYAFVLGEGSIDSPEEIEAVLLETFEKAIDHWQSVKSELASIHCMK